MGFDRCKNLFVSYCSKDSMICIEEKRHGLSAFQCLLLCLGRIQAVEPLKIVKQMGLVRVPVSIYSLLYVEMLLEDDLPPHVLITDQAGRPLDRKADLLLEQPLHLTLA